VKASALALPLASLLQERKLVLEAVSDTVALATYEYSAHARLLGV